MKLYKYFTYDPENNEFETYETLEEQEKAAEEIIKDYSDSDEGWPEETEDIFSGIITHTACKCNYKKRPKDSELDSEGYDEDGQHWPKDYAYMCDYKMLPLDRGYKYERG